MKRHGNETAKLERKAPPSALCTLFTLIGKLRRLTTFFSLVPVYTRKLVLHSRLECRSPIYRGLTSPITYPDVVVFVPSCRLTLSFVGDCGKRNMVWSGVWRMVLAVPDMCEAW
jgi:hypothetical protein